MSTATTTSIGLQQISSPDNLTPRTSQTNNDDEIHDAAAATLLADSAAPEGGYGWIIVAAASVINFWTTGTTYSWGILQAALLEQNAKLSSSTVSFVGSLWVASVAFLALINARIIRYVGARNAALTGLTSLGMGEILSGFTTNDIGGLFVTTGVVMGIGSSLCFMVNSVVPAQYFVAKRGIANGIVYAAAGLGGAICTILMNALVNKLGPAWAYRITGFLTLATGLPAAWLIEERTPIRRGGFVEWSLFREVRFVLLFLAGGLATFPLMVAPFFLPTYSTSVGLSSGTGAALVAAFNLSSAAGRIAFGYFCDIGGPVNSLLLSQLLGAISMLSIWPVAESFAPLVAFAIINGIANGGFFSTMPTVVGNVFGSARVSVAMGMIITSWAGGYLMGAPIAGYLLDAYGGPDSTLQAYHPAIFYAGSLSLGAAGLVLMARFKLNRRLFAKV